MSSKLLYFCIFFCVLSLFLTAKPVLASGEPTVFSVGGNFSASKNARAQGFGFAFVKGSIILTNAKTMALSTIKVNQSVKQWSDTMVLFNVNTGSFIEGNSVYLYVKKITGKYNASGFPIVIGQGNADTQAPVITSSFPQMNDVRVPINSKIRIELSDSDPGLNYESITLYIDNIKVSPIISQSRQNIILEYVPAIFLDYLKTVKVRVSAEDLDGNKLDKSFTFKTVPATAYLNIAWDLAKLTPSYATSDVDNSDTIRVLIEGKYLAFSADKIALEFIGRKDGDYRIRNVTIAEADLSSGAGKIVSGTWTKVLFDKQTNSDWQNAYVTVFSGDNKVSSALDFVIDPAKSYYVTFKNENKGISQVAYSDAMAFYYPAKNSFGKAQDYSLTQNWPSGLSSSVFGLSKVYAVNITNIKYKLFTSASNGSVEISQPGPYYNFGSQLTLTAVADNGYVFDHWSGDITGTVNPSPVIMDSNKTIIANFSASLAVQGEPAVTAYTLTIISNNGIAMGNTFSSSYSAGSVINFTAIPVTGYMFGHWAGDATGNVNPASIVMDTDKTVVANFTPVSPLSIVNLINNSVASLLSKVPSFLKRIFYK